MGIYYMWVNLSKRQYLDEAPFPDGLKIDDTAHVGSELTDAVSTLLAGPWRGDLVSFMGEAFSDVGGVFDLSDMPGLKAVASYPIDWYDIEEELENISGRLSCRRGRVGTYVTKDGSIEERLLEGPFDLELKQYRYVVNETKQEYYDRARLNVGFDPLPVLMSTSWRNLYIDGRPNNGPDGLWVGDLIVPSDEAPGTGYEDVTNRYTKRQ